jgi:hypothetical protein
MATGARTQSISGMMVIITVVEAMNQELAIITTLICWASFISRFSVSYVKRLISLPTGFDSKKLILALVTPTSIFLKILLLALQPPKIAHSVLMSTATVDIPNKTPYTTIQGL